jgi:4-amino-4-deoxy-L-arabinose transferase-like glycosyltransferase
LPVDLALIEVLDAGFPPLAAWTIRLATEALGPSERAIRAAAALHSGIFAAFLFLAARRLFGPRAALLVLAGATAVPLFSLGQVIVTPDGPQTQVAERVYDPGTGLWSTTVTGV